MHAWAGELVGQDGSVSPDNELLVVGWVTLGVCVGLTLLFSFLVVRHYTDRHDKHPLTTGVAVVSLSLTLLCVLAIPADISNVNSFMDDSGQYVGLDTIEDREANIRTMYIVLYSSLLTCGFLFIPFSYFYFEADYDNATVTTKMVSAAKYTALFVVMVGVLLVIGLVLQTDADGVSEDWIRHVLRGQTGGDSAVTFGIACISCVGLAGWWIYTTYGMVNVPLDLLLNPATPDLEASDVTNELLDTRESVRAMQSKYALTGRKMSRRDKKDLERMQEHIKRLERRRLRIQSRKSVCGQCVQSVSALVRAVGLVALLACLFIATALATTSVDRAMHSECGEGCGWAITHRRVWNPFDELLLNLNQRNVYSVDSVVIGLSLVFIVLCSLGGMLKLGVRFACIQLYKLQPHASAPQGLLLAVFHLMFIVMVLNAELLTLAPQYVTFGGQTVDGTNGRVLCTLDNVGNEPWCRMTQIATMLHQQTANLPFFGILFYIGNWVFLAFLVVFAIARAVRRKEERYDDDDDVDPDESQSLL